MESITSAHSSGKDTTKILYPDVLKSWRRPREAGRHLSLRGTAVSYHWQSIAATSFLLLQITKKADTRLKAVTY